MDAPTSRKQNLKYYASIILLGISPYVVGLLLYNIESFTPVGEIAGIAVGATMVLGVPFILITGLITSLVSRKDNRRRNLSGYRVSALLVNLHLLILLFQNKR